MNKTEETRYQTSRKTENFLELNKLPTNKSVNKKTIFIIFRIKVINVEFEFMEPIQI